MHFAPCKSRIFFGLHMSYERKLDDLPLTIATHFEGGGSCLKIILFSDHTSAETPMCLKLRLAVLRLRLATWVFQRK